MDEAAACAEIEALHEFFVDWFGGKVEQDQQIYHRRFAQRFAEDCELIQPAGSTVPREVFFAAVQDSYGCSPDFRIEIRNVRVRFALPENYTLVTYEEWQRNAVNSKPADNARAATVLFANDSTRGIPQWLHIHETWLPAAATPTERFNF